MSVRRTSDDIDRDFLERTAKAAMANAEAFRRMLEGGPPWNHDYPRRGTPEHGALSMMDEACEKIESACVRLGMNPARWPEDI